MIITNEQEIGNVAKELVRLALERSSTDRALLVFLQGDLGAGKTTLTKAVAKELGIQEDVTSPTFVILKRYELSKTIGNFKNLIHIDAYRLKDYEELKKISFEKYLENPENIILLEWPEIVVDGGLEADIEVRLSHGEKEGVREVHIS